jgi:hypothetical protein
MPTRTNYIVVVVPKVETQKSNCEIKRADPPPYDPETDKQAFDNAWKQVAKLKSEGKLAPTPPRVPKLKEKAHA